MIALTLIASFAAVVSGKTVMPKTGTSCNFAVPCIKKFKIIYFVHKKFIYRSRIYVIIYSVNFVRLLPPIKYPASRCEMCGYNIKKEYFIMNKSLRKAIIAGNWKMNKTRPEAKELLEAIKPLVANAKDNVEVIACVPFTNLETAVAATAGSNVKVGAENVHFEKSGAFTGEISADMLTEVGVEYVVVGHSERRQYFGETDETVNKRTKAALAAGLKPIVCVGELLWERECNITEEVIARQIKLDLFGISAEDVKKTVIAYEPVWAIGTGKTATAEQAQEVCAFIRATLAKIYDAATADAVTIQYGGSMNAKNCAELLSKPDVDGGLIGGASLKAEDFNTIVQAAVNG